MSNITPQERAIEQLFQYKKLNGKYCSFFPVTADDAQFILNLRTKRKDSFLKKTSDSLEDQIAYLKSYEERFKNREEIYYKLFDVQRKAFNGVVRLTQVKDEDHFNWQSLVVSEDSSPNLAIDVMLIIYTIGFNWLGRKTCGPWEVDRNFTKMMKIHDFVGMAKIVGGDETYHWVAVENNDFQSNIKKFNGMGYGLVEGEL